MKARLYQMATMLRESFWVIPGLLTLAGVLLALVLVQVDAIGLIPRPWRESSLLYGGGAAGARTLLGAVASSTIGIAGTVFTITIAALSLAAGQMGPRLLKNFTKDRANQMSLGVFLGTFSYALMVLRTVRAEEEGLFVPQLALSVGVVLAFVCVGTLIFFVGHMAGRINVDTVIELVSTDVGRAIERLCARKQPAPPPPIRFWRDAAPVVDPRRGYLQQLDETGLAAWAAERETVIRLLIKPGDHVFPGTPIAVVKPMVKGVDGAIRAATALGWDRGGAGDVGFAIKQLVEVAVRALSTGVNDPHTAISVVDRLGAALCDLAPLELPTGVTLEDGRPALVVPAVDYDGLVDAMFDMIRQNAAGSPAVLARILDALTAAASCEPRASRVETLLRHADLVMADACRHIASPADLGSIRRHYSGFLRMMRSGAIGYLEDTNEAMADQG